MSVHSLRALVLSVLALALIVPVGATFATSATAAPCLDCDLDGDGIPDLFDPDPPAGPVEEVTYTLSVQTEGRVTDEAGIDCPRLACSRSVTYTRVCTKFKCPRFAFSTITLRLYPEPGVTATWPPDCVPHAGDLTRCDVRLDRDRTVNVTWAENPDGPAVTPVAPPSPSAPDATTPPATDPGAGPAPDAGATVVSGTVETGGTTVTAGKRGAIRSTVRYSFRRTDAWTEFTRLQVRRLPRGATVRATCKGTGCPRGAVTAAAPRRTVELRRLQDRRMQPGTRITIRVIKPGRATRTTAIAVRRGQDPRLTVK